MTRPFTEVLGDLEGGSVADDLSVELADLTSQVMAVGKAGTLTLVVHVTPNGANSVEVRAEIKQKAPEPPRERTILFVGDDGSMIRQNPRQFALPLREVAARDARELPQQQPAKVI